MMHLTYLFGISCTLWKYKRSSSFLVETQYFSILSLFRFNIPYALLLTKVFSTLIKNIQGYFPFFKLSRISITYYIKVMNDPSRTEESRGLDCGQVPMALAADLTAREDLNEEVNAGTKKSNEFPDKKKIKRKFQNLLMYRINNATSEEKLESRNHKNGDDDIDDYEKRDEEK
ncbi:hypothetical protein GcC1_136012, partial [Golovinomyces cichoracearum]